MKQTKVLVFLNQKGGVAKTTTSINVADAMARSGLLVLLVDLDAQASLTHHLLGDKRLERSVYDAIVEGHNLPIVEYRENLHVAPANVRLSNLDAELRQAKDGVTRVRTLLSEVKGVYDYVIVDCPPSLGIITYNAIVASEHIIVPVEASLMSLNGLEMIKATVEELREYNSTTKVDGCVFVLYKAGRNLHKTIERILQEEYKDIAFKTVVRDNVKVAEAVAYHKTAFEHDPHCIGVADYAALTKEIIARYQ